jgi:hypothetical protein
LCGGGWNLRDTLYNVTLSVSVCVCIYIYIYIVYVVLYGKARKHGGAVGRLFASYQGTRSNESRKSAKYFTKYFESQTAERD